MVAVQRPGGRKEADDMVVVRPAVQAGLEDNGVRRFVAAQNGGRAG
jgi:hypothetical protein